MSVHRATPVLLAVLCACARAALPASPSPPAPASSTAPHPPAACALSAGGMKVQPLPSLPGFLKGPTVFIDRDPEGGATSRAVVRLSADGVAHVEALPDAFSDTVAVTASHTVFFRFSVDRQLERLEVLRPGGAAIVGELEGVSSSELVDSVDGSDGSTILAFRRGGGVVLFQIDRAGRIVEPTAAVTEHRAQVVRLALEAPGKVLVAWTEASDDRARTTLWLARTTEQGQPLGPPAPLDAAPDEQPVADVALARSEQGPIVAWNPIVSVDEGERGSGHDTTLGVALRVFRIPAQDQAVKVREQALTSHAGPIASVGGYILSNHVQALPLGRDVLLTWVDEGHPFASLVEAWSPMRLPAGSNGDSTVLVPLGDAAVLLSAGTQYGDGGYWPTLESVRIECSAR